MMTNLITAQRGTRVSTSRLSASVVPAAAHTCLVAPFGDRTWAGVRRDGAGIAEGHPAWSPPI